MGVDVYDLLWGVHKQPANRGTVALSRARIVAEAVAMADTEGLAKVSMPRLADRLGSGVMSLYRHVPGKQELVALMYDAALAHAPTLPTDQGWRIALADWGYAIRDVFLVHPWALPLATVNHVMGPNEFRWLDRALGALAQQTGLSSGERLVSVMAVNGFVRGAMHPTAEEQQNDPQWFRFLADPQAREDYPHVADLIADAPMSDMAIMGERFEFGLQRVLDGLESYFDTRTAVGSQ